MIGLTPSLNRIKLAVAWNSLTADCGFNFWSLQLHASVEHKGLNVKLQFHETINPESQVHRIVMEGT